MQVIKSKQQPYTKLDGDISKSQNNAKQVTRK